MKITDYIVVSASSVEELRNLVFQYLELGYKLQGGASASILDGNNYFDLLQVNQIFYQTLVKYEEADN